MAILEGLPRKKTFEATPERICRPLQRDQPKSLLPLSSNSTNILDQVLERM